ncbi:MAG: hypothetical protein N4J56_001310 [Chroococcidiopsis sp. SAG 2025]|nr:hypothetical protein [Chroococcidiopsis sp. SAG 2025]MDV2991656.1 hypothetical protein [Chroococcidiopsis sp. SAG 2025]
MTPAFWWTLLKTLVDLEDAQAEKLIVIQDNLNFHHPRNFMTPSNH